MIVQRARAKARSFWVAGALVIGGAAVLATPVQGKLSDLIAPSPPHAGEIADSEGASAAAIDREEAAAPSPTLTAAQRRRAVHLVRSYPRLRGFAGTATPRVSAVVPWTTEDGSSRIIGAEVDLTLPARRSVASTIWPSTAFVSERRYVRQSPRYAAKGVRGLVLTVDLRRGQVVSVAPDSAARVVLPPGAASAKPHRLPSNED